MYRMLVNSSLEPKAKAETIVYRCAKYDYGTARDDTRMTGVEHISVTLDKAGDYPFFTVALRDIERVEETA